MKSNKVMMKLVIYVICAINLFVWSTPAYAWTYHVQWGDSLYKLSQRYGTDVNTLKSANRLPSSQILAGSKLWIPPNSTAQTSWNSEDLNLLARLINGEARGEPFIGQVAVGSVILNRVKSSKFPNTIAGNIYQQGQFESVANGEIWQPLTASAIRAAKAALNGWDPSGGALYFYNPAKVYNPYNWV